MNNDAFLSQFDDLTPLNTNLDLNLIKDEPDFVMNNNGRLTEMKALKGSNNVHDYLYSLSKRENEGYGEKYKVEQHRKITESKKKAYKIDEYKKFTEDGLFFILNNAREETKFY